MIFQFFRFFSLFILFIGSQANGQECTITKYTTDDGLSTNGVTQLIFDQNKNLWIGTNGGLCIYNGQVLTAIKGNPYPRNISFFKDSKESIYLSNRKSALYKLNDKTFKWKILDNLDITQLGLDIYGHNDFGSMTTPAYWALFNSSFFVDSLLIRVSTKNRLSVITPAGESLKLKSSLPENIFNECLIFTGGNSTFAFTNNSIYKLSIKSDSLIKELVLTDIPLDKDSDALSSGQYNPITGYFYLGSALNGLYEIKPKIFDIRVSKEYSSKRGNAIYYNQVEYKENSILVNNQFVIKPNGTSTLLENPGVTDISLSYKDQENNFWFLDYTGLLKTNNQISKLFLLDRKINLHSACEGIDNTKYFCNDNTLISIDNLSEVTSVKKNDLGFANDEEMNYLFKKKNDSLIHILTNRSIYKYNPNNKEIKRIDFLPDADYRLMTYITDKIVFIGTYGDGYYLMYEDRFIRMPIDINEYLKFAHTALCDASGHVWISTNNGLFRTRVEDILEYVHGEKNEVFYYYFDKSSGFKTNEFNGGCLSPAIKLSDGTFSFSSIYGLVQFDPLEIPTIFPEEDIQITKLWLNEKLMDTIPSQLEINQGVREIKFDIRSAYYGHPNNYSIEYSIQGLTDSWHNLADDRYITIQNARHGNYDIVIRKRIGFGEDDFDYLNYPIHISPYFYQTDWFRILFAIVFFAWLIGIFLFYNRYSIRKNKELEKLIENRTLKLDQSNKELKNKVRQNELFQSIFVHDIKSPIKFITSNTELLSNFWDSLGDDLKLQSINHINEASTNIGNFIDETLLWNKIKNGELVVKNEVFAILPLLSKVVALYNTDAKIKRSDIQILLKCNPDLQWQGDAQLLATILRNLLANSIKYSKKGTIELSAQRDHGKLVIRCTDNGKGMTQELIDLILSKDYQGNDIREDSFRVGYIIIKEIVSTLNGELSIESEVDKGTIVQVKIIHNFKNFPIEVQNMN